MDKNRDDIIRKLFERSLEPKERGELNNYEFINYISENKFIIINTIN